MNLGNGAATFNTSALTEGMHNFSATYNGDTNFTKSPSNTIQLSVANATPVQFRLLTTTLIYPEPPAFEINIAVVGGKAPTGSITIYDTVDNIATRIAAYPLYAQSKGVLLGLVLPSLGVGQHSLTASYSGDANYAAGTSTAIVVSVSPGPVKLTLKCGNTQLKVGQTLSCSVNASEGFLPVSGTAGYTVTGWGSGSIVLDRSGCGTITYKPAKGTNTLTVAYAAQGNYQAASPASVTFEVK